MSTSFRLLLAPLVFAGCTSRYVMLLAPVQEVRGTCFEHCEALFGVRPTLNCGTSNEPLRVLVCSYDWPARPQASVPWAGPPAQGEAEASCRAECARAGFDRVEACWTAQTSGGARAVACRYRVGYH